MVTRQVFAVDGPRVKPGRRSACPTTFFAPQAICRASASLARGLRKLSQDQTHSSEISHEDSRSVDLLQTIEATAKLSVVQRKEAGAVRAGASDAVAVDEWEEWYRLTPLQRWEESQKLWPTYLALGGSLDPEPDSQSPFDDPEAWRHGAAHGRPGVRVLRRGGV